ncbi:extracellular solute-binding protein [Pseudooceanicola sp. HF7]|nr:extracellular solute-binding protein [Pseudooceanicola sp. HF7]NIZ09536.1 extracellular solute-binding protein [Pseudooceanicola sp. HF7]
MKSRFVKLTTAVSLAALPTLASAQDLVVLDWSGYEDPGFIGEYIEKHGSPPNYSFFGEEEEAFQKLRAGFKVDVAHPCSQSVLKWQMAGLIEPLDPSRIDRWEDVNEIKESFKIDGEYYMLPTDWGTTSLIYRTDLVDASKMDSLQVFTDPAYAGRVSLPNNVDDVYALAFLATGVTDWTNATQEQFEAASAWLRKVHPNVVTYWADGAELAQLLTTGEAAIAWGWNETPTTLAGEGVAVASNREAAEGSSSWFCGYVNVADGPNSEDAMYDFFNAWMDPASAEYIVEAWGYGNGNQAAMKALGGDVLDGVGLGPVSAPVLAQSPLDNRLREQMISEFENIKVGF